MVNKLIDNRIILLIDETKILKKTERSWHPKQVNYYQSGSTLPMSDNGKALAIFLE